MSTIVLGLQYGDEGKGKIIDTICDNYTVCARAQGGSNAGHTVFHNGHEFHLHLLPSGILSGMKCVIGNGCVINLEKLEKELEDLKEKGYTPNLFISASAHVVQDKYIEEDIEREGGSGSIGTTKQGIGPTYAHKMYRDSIRMESIDDDPYWTPMIIDTTEFLMGEKILIEGANGSLLDIDLGSYPFVTSSNTTVGGLISGLGIPFSSVKEVIGVFKAYLTRVGSGPMPTELFDDVLQVKGKEFGVTTQRKRRCGWLDLPQLRYSIYINGVTILAMTKLDVVDDIIYVCTHYEGNIMYWSPNKSDYVPVYKKVAKKDYVKFLENELGLPIKYIGIGPKKEDIILNGYNHEQAQ